RSADQGDYRGREGEIYIPGELDGLVTGVFGLDERKVARRKTSTDDAGAALAPASPSAAAAVASAPKRPVRPEDLERWYNFPPGDGAGCQIVIAEFGGGYFDEDLAAYCTKMGRRMPSVTAHGFGRPAYTLQEVMGLPADQRNAELGASVEVMMDVQIVAGLCPAAEIFVYFAPFTQKGWVDLLNAVIKGAPATSPVAVSVSWGGTEDDPEQLTPAAVQAIDDKLNALAHMGITVCVSSGDDGSGDQVSDGAAHCDYPASSAFALGVGGTEFSSAGREVVWWDPPGRRTGTKKGGGATGGGVSTVWARPSWQTVHVASLNPGSIDGRVVPDITALAGHPLYDLTFLGHDAPNGGTSASAPLWASLVARCSAALPASKQRRFLTRLLYAPTADGRALGAIACRPITSGNNTSNPEPGRGYAATTSFSAVAGWGAPDGQALLDALGKI
ncbi:MAG TPA: S53 family peptidase, partial [Phenylobacterium sp.]|nr:S53 family peptidase [Phenylobacterium sp.]